MQVVLSHPTGNANVRAIMSELQNADMLSEFHTTVAFNPSTAWIKILPTGLRQEVLRRSFTIDSEKIKTHPFREMLRLTFPKMGIKALTRHEDGWASVDAVYHHADRQVAKRLGQLVKKKNLSAVYAYEDGALATFKAARELGLKCIYDLPIAYWETGRRLMKEEAERLPAWAETLGGGIRDSERKLQRKTQELELADAVVGPGSFVMDSLPTWAGNKVKIISPFGSPPAKHEQANIRNKAASKSPLRVLFVGSMGQRKGLGDLFAAVKLLNTSQLELVVLGSTLLPMDFYRNQLSEFTYESGRSHQGVLELMRTCDVFCLPSIVEGRALVMQEAMSQGLPLIITPNTGGSDLVKEGETGFCVPIRSPEAIAQKLQWFLDNRDQISAMGKKAMEHAATYTWQAYGKNVVRGISEMI